MRTIGLYAFAVVSLAASGACADSIDHQVAQCWNPPTGYNQTTSTRFSLDAQGKLVGDPVAASSDEYSKAAIRAIRRCEPYKLGEVNVPGPFEVTLRFAGIEELFVVQSTIPLNSTTASSPEPRQTFQTSVPDTGLDPEVLALFYVTYLTAEECAKSGASFTSTDVDRIKLFIDKALVDNPVPQADKDSTWDYAARAFVRVRDVMTHEGCAADKLSAYRLIPSLADGQVPTNPF